MAGRRKVDEKEEINMTPMLDIVFIMLIFFIVTATFVKETGIEPDLPTAQSAEKKTMANILIAISEKGEIWVEGRPVELGAVQSVLARLYAENPKGSLSIKADEDAPGFHIVNVIDEAKAAGVLDISVSLELP
jgi:biopolymer transport protein ExbD